jgi:hypothetical protein
VSRYGGDSRFSLCLQPQARGGEKAGMAKEEPENDRDENMTLPVHAQSSDESRSIRGERNLPHQGNLPTLLKYECPEAGSEKANASEVRGRLPRSPALVAGGEPPSYKTTRRRQWEGGGDNSPRERPAGRLHPETQQCPPRGIHGIVNGRFVPKQTAACVVGTSLQRASPAAT